MKPLLRRLAATCAATVVLSLQAVGVAVADPEIGPFNSEQCRATERTADADVPRAWHLDRLQMEVAWGAATGKGIKVAVIDTGVAAKGTAYFTPDRLTTYDFLGGASEKDKAALGMDCTHGTEVASLIAAGRPDGRDVDTRTNFAGIAPDAQIISYRTLSVSEPQEGEVESLAPTIAAVLDATTRKVRVINLSQSVGPLDPLLDDYGNAVAAALKQGIVVVAAAGNVTEGVQETSYPAAFPGVIAVGSSTPTDGAAKESRPGSYVTVGAPGSDITALLPSRVRDSAGSANQAYTSALVGTSYAAPIVSGVVALMLEIDPTLTPEQVLDRLKATADPPPTAVPDDRLGAGIVNPMRAMTGVMRPQTPEPGADASVAVAPLPTREPPDMQPAMVAVGVGIGALVLAAVGLVAAVTIPAAVRRGNPAD
ncbi:S8 family serine peptidase [Tessaracoccus antarcticus]|uniref:S8 family serine peptidase n=1 Tax=Tessaracoccus antarcticus TaxID=2479848 RepID=UPI001314F064|nr:S8 family serine peptidase [Tessaracoccus antarcticus]